MLTKEDIIINNILYDYAEPTSFVNLKKQYRFNGTGISFELDIKNILSINGIFVNEHVGSVDRAVEIVYNELQKLAKSILGE